MAAESSANAELKIAHILFIDIVGYSKLFSDKQRELFELLNELIRNTALQAFFAAAVAAVCLSRSVARAKAQAAVLFSFGTHGAPLHKHTCYLGLIEGASSI